MNYFKQKLASTAAVFTKFYAKYETKPVIIKLTEFYIKFERKSLVTRCLFLSALAHAFILFPTAFISPEKFVEQKPVGIEVSLGENFGSQEFRPLDEIDSVAKDKTLQQNPVQTPIANEAPKAELKADKVVKTKPQSTTEIASTMAKQDTSNQTPGIDPKDYLELLQYTVEDLSEVPDGGERLKGVAVLRLEFNRQGFVTRYALKKPTGQPILDQAATAVAARLMHEPFPAAPDGFDKGEPILRYDFLIKYPPKPRVSHS